VIKVQEAGRRGVFVAVAPISHIDGLGVQRADPHALRVRPT